MLLHLLCAKKCGKMRMIPALMRVPVSDSESIASLFSFLAAYLLLARKDEELLLNQLVFQSNDELRT